MDWCKRFAHACQTHAAELERNTRLFKGERGVGPLEAHDFEAMIASLRVPRDLLLKFFVTFSRFEYALKATGFTKDPPAAADASWDKFENWLETLSSSELAPVLRAGRYLLTDPPRRLAVSNGDPRWELPVRQGQSDTRFLVEGLRRARNNLFHGGKWLTPPALPERNELVISAGAAALSALISLPSAHDLRRHFEEL